jgi:arylsulfatase A-like enzyme
MDLVNRPVEPAATSSTHLSLRSILAWSIWIGLGSGTLELAIFWLKCRYLDPRNLNVSRHFIWMYPAAGLMVIGGLGCTLGFASRLWKRTSRTAYALFALFFAAYAGLLFRAPVYTSVCLLLAAGLAWKTAAFVDRRSNRLDGLVRGGVCVPLGLLALTVGVSFGREVWLERRASRSNSGVPSRSKNVILIVMDTVRAESLSLYGYGRDTTPQLNKLAGRGLRFDQAYSTAPWTAPSHASLFTGRWPHELTIGWDRPLDSTFPTLAEVLGSKGYATAGFVANTTYCSDETGLARGFAHYEDYDITLRSIWLCSSVVERSVNFLHKHPALAKALGDDGSSSGDRKDASRINRDFLGWLDRRGPEQPFFAFLNYYDAHHPYLTPEPDFSRDFGRKPGSARDFRLLKTWWERDKLGMKPADLDLARDSYDRCIAYLDDQLGRLFDDLSSRGVLDDSIVIVTSDHGEHLGERNLYGHGCSVYRPELHVPLLIVATGKLPEGRVIAEPVSLRDVPATVMDLLGLGGPSSFPGRSLVNSASSEVRSEIECPPEDDPNRGRSPASKGAMTSIVIREFHYIRGGDGVEELFDLKRDPNELRDLANLPEMAETIGQFREKVRK